MHGYTPSSRAFTSFRATLHGLDAAHVELRHDEPNDAWFIDLNEDESVSIRIDPKRGDENLREERAGLRKLAEAIAQLDTRIGQRLSGLAGEEDS